VNNEVVTALKEFCELHHCVLHNQVEQVAESHQADVKSYLGRLAKSQ
jgi:hypothetical protein